MDHQSIGSERSSGSRLSRRAFLGTAAASAGLMSGCLSSGSPPERTPTPPSEGYLPAPTLGDPDADIVVEVYEDFACPHCRTYSLDVFPQLRQEYIETGQISYVYHDFPIPVNESVSWEAASAARAVQDVAGDEAFFAYSKTLYERQGSLGGASDYREAAETLSDAAKLEPETVGQAGVEEDYRPTVAADRAEGEERGVEGTPTVVVNGSGVQWDAVRYEPIKDLIETKRS